MIPLISILDLEKNGSIKLLRGNGISKKDFADNGIFKCIHYGDLYTLYTPIIKKVLRTTNINGKIRSVSGDVLIPATTTADAMGIAIARAINEDDVVLGGDINIVRTQNKVILAAYLSYMINYPLKPKLAQYAKGTNILHLNNNDIRKLIIPIPPLQEQERIVAKLDEAFEAIDKVKTTAQQKIKECDELKQSILQKAFRGEL